MFAIAIDEPCAPVSVVLCVLRDMECKSARARTVNKNQKVRGRFEQRYNIRPTWRILVLGRQGYCFISVPSLQKTCSCDIATILQFDKVIFNSK